MQSRTDFSRYNNYNITCHFETRLSVDCDSFLMSEVLVKLGKERVGDHAAGTVVPPTDTDTEVAKRLLGTLINFAAGVSPQSGDRVRSNLVSLLVGAVLHQSACNLDMLLMIPKVNILFHVRYC